jgi:hypothetical protein
LTKLPNLTASKSNHHEDGIAPAKDYVDHLLSSRFTGSRSANAAEAGARRGDDSDDQLLRIEEGIDNILKAAIRRHVGGIIGSADAAAVSLG